MSQRPKAWILWLVAVLLMGVTVIWQRRTGPTHPLRGVVELGDRTLRLRLLRSHDTVAPARVEIPDPGCPVELHWRRHPTSDPWSVVPLRAEGEVRVAELPVQPAAGKVAYRLVFHTDRGIRVFPQGDPVILRYKDPVAPSLLVAHVVAMFLGVLLGIRTGLAAGFGEPRLVRWVGITLGFLGVGGLVLGPFVQHQAFGAYWTGWPFGGDLTDNKTLIMVLVWIGALVSLRSASVRIGRGAVVLAALGMLVVYWIPHSLRGSQLDYQRLEAGHDPKGAITTGR